MTEQWIICVKHKKEKDNETEAENAVLSQAVLSYIVAVGDCYNL